MKSIALTILSAFILFTINAQDEKSKVHVIMEVDGKVVKDTVYHVEKGTDPKLASKILDMTFSGEKKPHKAIAFYSEDGELHELEGDHEMMMKELHGDGKSHVFVTTEEGEDGETRVTVKKIKMDKDGEKEWTVKDEDVYVIKSGDGEETYTIESGGEKPQWIEKDGNKVLVIKSDDGSAKKIKIVSDGDSGYSYTTEEGETIIIHTSKDSESKEVKLKVIVEDEKGDSGKTKESKKDKKDKK